LQGNEQEDLIKEAVMDYFERTVKA
jgi:hypothetical protein